MALLLALAVNVGVGTMVESFSRTFLVWLDGRLAADVYVIASRRRAGDTRSRHGCAIGRRSRRSCPAAAPTRNSAACRSRCWASPITRPIAINWPLLESTRGCLDPAASRRCRSRQRAIGAASEACDRRPHRGARAGRQLAARGGRHLCRLRQPKGADRGQFRRADAAFPGIPLTRLGLRVWPSAIPALISALQEKFGLDDRNVADQATMKAESTRDLQPHLRRDGGVERLHARRCRHRIADQPADARAIPACRNWRRYGRSESRGGGWPSSNC